MCCRAHLVLPTVLLVAVVERWGGGGGVAMRDRKGFRGAGLGETEVLRLYRHRYDKNPISLRRWSCFCW